MSTESKERGPLDIPRLSGELLEFAETILSIGVPYDYAVQAFLESFPSFLEHEVLTESEIYETLRKRFKEMRCSTRRLSYQKIKETEVSLKKLLDCIPVASPLIRLIELEKLRQDPDLECEQRIKVLVAAAKETERLIPRERISPFSGLPDLIPPPPEPESDTPTKKDVPPGDSFGGAMMKNNADTGQETSDDS